MQSSCPLGNTYRVPPMKKQTLELNFHKSFDANLGKKIIFIEVGKTFFTSVNTLVAKCITEPCFPVVRMQYSFVLQSETICIYQYG